MNELVSSIVESFFDNTGFKNKNSEQAIQNSLTQPVKKMIYDNIDLKGILKKQYKCTDPQLNTFQDGRTISAKLKERRILCSDNSQDELPFLVADDIFDTHYRDSKNTRSQQALLNIMKKLEDAGWKYYNQTQFPLLVHFPELLSAEDYYYLFFYELHSEGSVLNDGVFKDIILKSTSGGLINPSDKNYTDKVIKEIETVVQKQKQIIGSYPAVVRRLLKKYCYCTHIMVSPDDSLVWVLNTKNVKSENQRHGYYKHPDHLYMPVSGELFTIFWSDEWLADVDYVNKRWQYEHDRRNEPKDWEYYKSLMQRLPKPFNDYSIYNTVEIHLVK